VRVGRRCEDPEGRADRIARRRPCGPLSDWDFKVTAARFDEVRHALPQTVRPLRPAVAQRDRLSRTWCYMLILTGPAKVGLIFGHPH